jgi:hypothetical protein
MSGEDGRLEVWPPEVPSIGGVAARGTLDLDTFWEGLKRRDLADGLPEVTGVACSLEADEIGSEDTM